MGRYELYYFFRDNKLAFGTLIVTLILSCVHIYSFVFAVSKSYYTVNPKEEKQENREYYLSNKLPEYIDKGLFKAKVDSICDSLDIPYEWLMAVMYSESKLDPTAVNLKGSRATGFIQFMPLTAISLGTTVSKLKNMNYLKQLFFVERYLSKRRKGKGFTSLTNLYLSILYPKAMNRKSGYALYCYPGKAYRQNSGLDEDKDGCVRVSDIESRMRRVFPTAFKKERR